LSLGSWSTNEGTFFTAIVRDLTERRFAERMRVEKEAAEAANVAKSAVVARISHELRAPLNAIVGFSQILLVNQQGNLQDRDIDFLQRILLNTRDLLNLINGLQDLAKIEAGRIDVSLSEVSVDELVRETVRQIESTRDRTGVELRAEVADGIPLIAADAAKLKQVLVNLIDNALKFTRNGAVAVRVRAEGEYPMPVRIEVEDTGIGIPPDRLSDIFEPFTRIPNPGVSVGGSGLGLAISRSLCDLMGYRLEVRSTPGKGSIFSIIVSSDRQLMPRTA
jgi:signal transduction histidine kinase